MTRVRSGRDRYIDVLRAVALGRVALYHAVGWVWLPFLFPSMGIMFALAGSLAAASVDRADHDTLRFIGARLRRVLPPVWALAVIAVPLLLWQGWDILERLPDAATLVYWILPFSDPPYPEWASEFGYALWYIRTYVWFVVLSPAALWLFRRWGLRTLALPVGVAVASGLGWLDLYDGSERAGDIRMDLATYGACWLLGFAHHDGMLARLSAWLVVPAGVALLGTGAWWAVTHPDPDFGIRVDAIPFAQTLYCLGGVLLLLRFYLSMQWLTRVRWLDHLVSLVNARAVTIYLWHTVAIALAALVMDRQWAEPVWASSVAAGTVVYLSLVAAFVAVVTLSLGWVEDLAARRTPRAVPRVGRRPDAPAPPPPTPPAPPPMAHTPSPPETQPVPAPVRVPVAGGAPSEPSSPPHPDGVPRRSTLDHAVRGPGAGIAVGGASPLRVSRATQRVAGRRRRPGLDATRSRPAGR